MANERSTLAAQRARLIADCAQQREAIAAELDLLKAPVQRISAAADFLHTYRKPLLAGAGILSGLLLARPQRALGVLASGASLWKLGRAALPTLQRLLPLLLNRLRRRPD